ncbi:MAG TPA: SCO family protein [Pyrinomonadaceae bacterium]|jgi:protein SCO1/2|nr:SCO family protein [Pyrinomonadaceae bacterium]
MLIKKAETQTRRAAFLLCAALTSLSCSPSAPRADAKRYELRGTIVSFNKDQRQVVIAHEAVPGLMEGMTMPFTLKEPSAYDVMRPGDRIQATLVVDGERTVIESPAITHAEPDAAPPASSPSQPSEPQLGSEVPDFTLTNQDGKKVALRDYRGRALALTFIYTRCPLPDYCVLMSNNFAALDRALAREPELAAKSGLLSVSIDPAYDTPKVLRSYGAAHTENYKEERFERWQLATGDAAEVRRVANFFGLVYAPDGDQIVHSLRTAVVAPDGKLYKVYRGGEWKPEDVLNDFRQLAATK